MGRRLRPWRGQRSLNLPRRWRRDLLRLGLRREGLLYLPRRRCRDVLCLSLNWVLLLGGIGVGVDLRIALLLRHELWLWHLAMMIVGAITVVLLPGLLLHLGLLCLIVLGVVVAHRVRLPKWLRLRVRLRKMLMLVVRLMLWLRLGIMVHLLHLMLIRSLRDVLRTRLVLLVADISHRITTRASTTIWLLLIPMTELLLVVLLLLLLLMLLLLRCHVHLRQAIIWLPRGL